MEEWKEYQLGDLVELKNGVAFKSNEFIEHGIPVIKIKNVKPNRILLDDLSYVSEQSSLNKKCFDILPSDILITMTGNRKDGGADSWVGKVALFKKNGKYLLNQRVSAIRVKRKELVDFRFLAYLLSGWDAQLYFVNHSNSSGGQANISPDIVYGYPISLPSIGVQRNIANIISSLDDKIEVNRRMNDNLEQQAQALFKSWFVDFEPFKDGEFVESELGMIPKGWRVEKLENLGKIICGKTPSKTNKEFFNGDIHFIKIPDMHNNVFILQTEDHLSNLGEKSQLGKRIPPYSILVSCIATVGLVAMNTQYAHTNQQINSIIPNEDNARFYLFLRLKFMKEYIQNMGRGGTATLNVNTKQFGNISIVLPSKDVLSKYAELVFPIFKKIEKLEQESSRLSSLRDTLLPRLMSGELKINDISV